MTTFLTTSGVIAWLAILVFFLIRYFSKKYRFARRAAKGYLGADLVSSTQQVIKEATEGQLQRDTIAEFTGHLLQRLTRIGMLTILIAITPLLILLAQTYLLNQQNKLLVGQNERFDVQNERINLQNNLIEAERRSSLVFLMSTVLDRVGEETPKAKIQIGRDSSKFRLSKSLIGRIVALSKSFRPYKRLDTDTLNHVLISPERGQFLISLLESNLDSYTMSSITEYGDFDYAEIQNYSCEGAFLHGISFHSAQLQNTDFASSNMGKCDLTNANLTNANLPYADLSYSNLKGANLTNANMAGTNLTGAAFNILDISKAKRLIQLVISPERQKELDSLKAVKPCLFTYEGCK